MISTQTGFLSEKQSVYRPKDAPKAGTPSQDIEFEMNLSLSCYYLYANALWTKHFKKEYRRYISAARLEGLKPKSVKYIHTVAIDKAVLTLRGTPASKKQEVNDARSATLARLEQLRERVGRGIIIIQAEPQPGVIAPLGRGTNGKV